MNDDENAPAVEETQEQAPEQIDAPEPQEQEQAPEPAEESPSEESAEPSQVTQEEPEEEVDWSQYVPNVTQPLPVDENGQVDPVAFREQMRQESRFEAQEVRSWTRLETQHPELRSDAGLREMILAKRIFDVQQGKTGTLEAAANEVFNRLSGAKNEGKASQATSITVQKSAALQKPSGAKSTAPANDLRDRINRGDQGAIHSTLTAWLDDGKI